MSSHEAMNPNGGAENMRRVMENRPLDPVTVEYAVSRGNMRRAWKQVKANGGAPGVDGITIGEFPTYAKTDWVEIKTSLLNGAYKPCPVKRVEIPKDNGGTRNLGIPVVMDRVIQQAISQILTPVFDPHFSESSFGFSQQIGAPSCKERAETYSERICLRRGHRPCEVL